MSSPLVTLVTAGSAGLGAATARLFAREGFRVVVNYFNNAERAESLLQELKTLSPLPSAQTNFVAIRADLASREDLKKLVAEAVSSMGRLDVVFSNGGWTRLTNFMDLDDNLLEDDWDRCFNMNVKSHLFLMHAAKEHLDKTKGSFITTASIAGVKASGSSLPYSVTKAAQIHLVKGLARSCGPNIRVNSVSPGLLLTEWGLRFSKEVQDKNRDGAALKQLPEVDDVAEQVLAYVKNRSVTGTNLVIDGGLYV